MKRLRIGLAGAGLIGLSHIRHIALVDECELVAIADPRPEAAQTASGCGVRHYGDIETMLDSERPDGVVVATPNQTHTENALACIARGIPALVEKPISDNVSDARRIVAASEDKNVPILVGHHRRHSPLLQCAHEIVADGRLGRIASVAALVNFLKPDPYFNVAWRTQPGGGPVNINAIHAIDDLRFLCGEVAELKSLTSNALRGFAVEDSAVVALRFESGAVGTLTLSDKAAAPWSWELTSGENPAYPHLPEDCYFISGTEGALAVPSLRLWRYGAESGWNAPLPMSRVESERADPLTLQIRHFCAVIRGTEKPKVSAADATRTLTVTLAIHEDAATAGRGVGAAQQRHR